jgi:predicted AlkP superfamily phosphohydrolase/phosphomutase
MVVSDHGFNSFRKGVNLNRWLEEHEYQVLQADPDALGPDRSVEVWQVTAWDKTRAYVPGMAGVYLNVVGREPFGTVTRGPQYQRLREEIRRGLEELRDPETGETVVHRVYRREELYDGPHVNDLPDLVVGFRPGYRTERGTLKVGADRAVITDNLTKWSGDHITVDPEFVPGILFSNRKVTTESPGIMDLAPTVLSLLGVPTGSWMDGRALSLEPRTRA